MTPRLLAALIVVSAATPGFASGQADPEAVKRRNDCRLAAQVIETGHPAPRRAWAWQYIGFCDPAQKVGAYSAAMRAARSSTDLGVIRRAILPAVGFRDGQLFAQVVDIAQDRSATVPARVVALVALAAIADPLASPSYEGFVGGLDEGGQPRGWCSRIKGHATGFHPGPTPLPSDYRERIRALSNSLRNDSSAPDDVRSAAACI